MPDKCKVKRDLGFQNNAWGYSVPVKEDWHEWRLIEGSYGYKGSPSQFYCIYCRKIVNGSV
jgi:hypothetical protein